MPHDSTRRRVVPATHGRQPTPPDPVFETLFVEDLRANHGNKELLALYQRFSHGDDRIDRLMRRVCIRALSRNCGAGLSVGVRVSVRHPETFSLGEGVFIGEGAMIHGRHDGNCRIGSKTWIGPQSYLDARDLVIGEYVGWGPGARVLGSTHTGIPADVPLIATDLVIAPVHVHDWADIGVGAVLLPGVVVGRGAIVGASAVVTRDVPPMAKVAGVPAQVIGWRAGEPDARTGSAPPCLSSHRGSLT